MSQPYEPVPGPVQSPEHPHGQPAQGYGVPAYGAPGHGAPGHGAPGHGAPGHGAPGYGGPGYGAPGYPPAPQRTNVMSILGLVFAFVFSPLGLVFSAIGLSQTKKRGEGGRGLAIAGLILSILFMILSALFFLVFFAAFQQAAENAAAIETEISAPAEESPAGESPGTQPADTQGVLAACQTIGPAMVAFESDMMAVTTPEDYMLAITEVRAALEGAAAATTDPVFVADVQLLSDNLQLAADTVANGEDPTYLEAALTEDGTRIDMDCAAAGYTGP